MKKILFAVCLGLFLTSGCAEKSGTTDPVVENSSSNISTAAKGKKALSREDRIRNELNETARKLLTRASRNITPSKSKKEVAKYGNEYVAKYIEINPNKYSIDMKPAKKAGTYNGFVRYTEQVYQCRGKTAKQALSAPCTPAGGRRLNEMLHYDGKKWYY